MIKNWLNMRLSLIILLLVSSPLFGSEDRCDTFPSRDHKKLWPDNSIRQQCNTGACHSFATVSLVEAMHKKLKGEYIDLSERDLFSQHFGASTEAEAKKLVERHINVAKRAGRDLGHWVERLKNQERLNGWTPSKTLKHYAQNYQLFQEGGYVDEDFLILRNSGICREEELPFSWYSGGEQGQEALVCLRQARSDIIQHIGECKVNGTYSIRAANSFCRDIEKILSNKEVYAGLVNDVTAQCSKQRKEIRSFSKTLSLKKKRPHLKLERTREEINRYLSCQPLAMDVKGYSNLLNGEDKVGHSVHAVVLSGYDCKSDEYLFRNSWGGKTQDRIPATEVLKNLETYYLLHKGKHKDCN